MRDSSACLGIFVRGLSFPSLFFASFAPFARDYFFTTEHTEKTAVSRLRQGFVGRGGGRDYTRFHSFLGAERSQWMVIPVATWEGTNEPTRFIVRATSDHFLNWYSILVIPHPL